MRSDATPFVVKRPERVSFWHPTLNAGLKIEDFSASSKIVVWWQCPKGHEWNERVFDRTRAAHDCPVCANRKVIAGVNDAATTHSELLQFWHPEKNGSASLTEIVSGSAKKYWWQGTCGHEWQSPIRVMAFKSRQCPYCSGQEVLEGFNDLATVIPVLAAEWHPTKNGTKTPQNTHNGSGHRVWWQCDKGHEWEATVHDRKVSNYGCPYCSRRYAIPDVTDLRTTHPELYKELHPSKNKSIDVDKLMSGSSIKVWWKCVKGHEWETYVYNRGTGKGCPNCSNQLSRGEKELAEYIESLVGKESVVLRSRSVIPGMRMELDIFVPSHNIAIEFNGLYWHSEAGGKDKNYHYNKWKTCRESGIQLIQIWEDEWSNKTDIVKSMLRHKLGFASSSRKVYGRNTFVTEISFAESAEFLEKYHIQGAINGTKYLALREKNKHDVTKQEIVAVVVLAKSSKPNEWILSRFATSCSVPGGFSKLIKEISSYEEIQSLITFSDNCVSDGALYESQGFVMDGELRPDYSYKDRNMRYHKFRFRKERFRKDPKLLWQSGLSERELAHLNGLSRIWDAGKIRWRKVFDRTL